MVHLTVLNCVMAMQALPWLVGMVAANDAPILALEPDHGPCGALITARGEHFPPGSTVFLRGPLSPAGRDLGSDGPQPSTLVAADGTFALQILPCNASAVRLPQYVFTADTRSPDGLTTGAAATFSPEAQCFAQTGKCVDGRFLAYWQAHGGLAVNGYPLSDEFDQQLEDGKVYTVQYFERVRMEYHPENQPPYDVLLGQFGRHFHSADPAAPQQPDATYFPETGHNVRPDFLAYWQANGGLAQFGYPISEELREQLEDGNTYTVQYFERHPENPAPYAILLGQFGRAILVEVGR